MCTDILCETNANPNDGPTCLWSRSPLQVDYRQLNAIEYSNKQMMRLVTYAMHLEVLQTRWTKYRLPDHLYLFEKFPTGRMFILAWQKDAWIIREA